MSTMRGEEDDEVGGDEKEAWSCLGRIFSQFINALSGLCHRGTIFRKNCLMDNVKFKESCGVLLTHQSGEYC